ncbi:hypothetical protein OCU04_005298 [Sclerotinia nivalis]|uniref:2EXR domain-containing protein n=1 Tax=Sclerotinia nivalis TaxID=352851 RepID=A0A9X0DMN5_9HELO|nr:hypothetical protein OCU04_005298 [Sclerotinia nivalis]
MLPSKQPTQGDVLAPSTKIVADNMSYDIDVQVTKTFESFARLAIELRLNIWRLACPQERLLKIRLHPVDPTFDLDSPTPSILFVNHESRDEAGKFYTKVRLRLNQAADNRKMFRTFYVNIDRDILSLDSGLKNPDQEYYFEGDFLAHYKLTLFSAETCLRALFREMRIVKTSDIRYDQGMGMWFLEPNEGGWTHMPCYTPFDYMLNLKKLVLSPVTFKMQGYLMGRPYYLSPEQQSVCIKDIRTYFEQVNKGNPDYSLPAIEFESGGSPST